MALCVNEIYMRLAMQKSQRSIVFNIQGENFQQGTVGERFGR